MDTLGWDRPAPDDFDRNRDLALLNSFVRLDALHREKATLRRRVLAHWETFQRHQAAIQGDVRDDRR